jgi:tRNA(Glu) U13 pseudouridine synthase TruD
VSEAGVLWLRFALPSGSYATEVLEQVGVTVPERRSPDSDARGQLR